MEVFCVEKVYNNIVLSKAFSIIPFFFKT